MNNVLHYKMLAVQFASNETFVDKNKLYLWTHCNCNSISQQIYTLKHLMPCLSAKS